MIKEIILVLVIALTSTSAHFSRGFHRHNHGNEPVGGENDVFNHPWNGWQNRPGMDQSPGNFQNEVLNEIWNQLNRALKKTDKRNMERTSTSSTSTTQAIPSITTGSVSTTTASPAFIACTYLCRIGNDNEPVCGTDGISYYNSQVLACAVRCGRSLSKAYEGPCQLP